MVQTGSGSRFQPDVLALVVTDGEPEDDPVLVSEADMLDGTVDVAVDVALLPVLVTLLVADALALDGCCFRPIMDRE